MGWGRYSSKYMETQISMLKAQKEIITGNSDSTAQTTEWKVSGCVPSRVPLKVLLRRNFQVFFPTVFLKNVKYRCKLREIIMNRVRLNIFCLDTTLQKSQKLVRHCFVRKPRVRCILHQRVCFVTSSNQPSLHLLQKYTESVWIHLVYRRITSPNKVLI